jgi:glycosyltransferase involved in cell wall biosynthesis
MKILQVCSKAPFPSKDGGSIAMNIITEGLIASGNQVTVLAINTPKHFIKDEEIDPVYRKKTAYRSVFIDTSVKPLAAFLNLFSNQSYNITRFYSREFEKVLTALLSKESFDVIQLETLWVTPYVETVRKKSKAKIVFRSHNVEYMIWERLASISRNPLKGMYLKLLSGRLKKYEIGMLNKYDGIACITELDVSVFKKAGCTIPIIHIPFGVNLSDYKPVESGIEFPSVFHIGAMDWMPNEEAIKWFLNIIWPKIQLKYPNLNLYLAGRNMPSWLLDLKMKNVLIEGEVSDSVKFMNSKSIMIVPLQSGGGMRVKIIEGMALAKTIISTSIGAEGIAYENNVNLLIADTEIAFEQAIMQCITDKAFSDTIGKSARTLIETKYDNRKICERLFEFYQTLN